MARQTLAFGVEPSPKQYNLRLARYQGLAEGLAEFVRAAPPGKKFALLDIGVGNGRTLRYLEPEGVSDRITFHGIDLSPRRLAGLYKPQRWCLAQGNVEHGLPYATGAFDIAVCEQVLEHLNDPRSVLREVSRVLRPGGLFVAGVPTFPPGLDLIRRHIVPLIDRAVGKERGHAQVFTTRSFVRVLESAGELEVDEARGFRIIGGLPYLESTRWWWKLNRSLGRAAPALCIEVQVVARKREDAPG